MTPPTLPRAATGSPSDRGGPPAPVSPPDPEAVPGRSGSDDPGGFVAVLATDGDRSADFLAELADVVRRSPGGVLIRLERPVPWGGGPVVGFRPRPAAEPGTPDVPMVDGPLVWLGPLRSAGERRTLCTWLDGWHTADPSGRAVPRRLRHRVLTGRPRAARHTAN